MFCSNCGAQIEDGAKFCSSCGTPVAQVEAQQPAQNAQPVQPQQPAQSGAASGEATSDVFAPKAVSDDASSAVAGAAAATAGVAGAARSVAASAPQQPAQPQQPSFQTSQAAQPQKPFQPQQPGASQQAQGFGAQQNQQGYQRPGQQGQGYQRPGQQQGYGANGGYTQHPAYQPAGNDYYKMGGWLLVFVVIMLIDVVYSIITSIGGIGDVASVADYSYLLPDGFIGLAYFMYIFALLAAVAEAWIVYMIFKRDAKFLRIYQLLKIIVPVVLIICTIAFAVMFDGYPVDMGDLVGSTVGSVIASIVGLVLVTLYFCRSERVKVYMGNTEYADHALFRFK